MIELEVKARVRDPKRIRRCLSMLEHKPPTQQHQRDIYFKSPFRDFRETDEILRVREQNPGSDVVTYKGPRLKSQVKAREEIEVNIDHSSEAVELLKRLGYEPWITIEKEREIHQSNDFVVSFDDVKELGHFIEIETKVAGLQSKHEGEQKILNLIDEIGISRKLIEKRTYLELISEKHVKSL